MRLQQLWQRVAVEEDIVGEGEVEGGIAGEGVEDDRGITVEVGPLLKPEDCPTVQLI